MEVFSPRGSRCAIVRWMEEHSPTTEYVRVIATQRDGDLIEGVRFVDDMCIIIRISCLNLYLSENDSHWNSFRTTRVHPHRESRKELGKSCLGFVNVTCCEFFTRKIRCDNKKS